MSSSSDDGELLPALGDNATALSLGFYHGFLAWVGFKPPKSDAHEDVPENGWYYAGYMFGWTAKLGLLIGVGEFAFTEGMLPGHWASFVPQ